MIQLATDPQASRSNWRPAAAEARATSLAAPRRTGHAWPFIARQGERAQQPEARRTPGTTSGS